MIYVARLLSMIGAALAIPGAIALFVITVAEDNLKQVLDNYADQVFAITLIGAVVLFAGQKLGNDLFRVRQIYNRPKDYDPSNKADAGIGGDHFGGFD